MREDKGLMPSLLIDEWVCLDVLHTHTHTETLKRKKKNAAERAVKLREDEIITHTELPSDPFWQQSTGSLHADVQTFSKPGSALTFAV